jgi:hypothetical protein
MLGKHPQLLLLLSAPLPADGRLRQQQQQHLLLLI